MWHSKKEIYVKDISNQKFNRMTAVKFLGKNKHNHNVWLFRCECGTFKACEEYSVRSGRTKSCGCFNYENLKSGNNRRKHGKHETRLYRIWKGIHARCDHPIGKSQCYKNVFYCDEWKDFEPFYEWSMSHGYQDNLSIDRIDNDKGYSPDNCRWVTMKQQADNRRTSRFVTFNGRTQTVTDWMQEFGFTQASFYRWVDEGLTDEQVIERFSKKRRTAVDNSTTLMGSTLPGARRFKR